MSAGPGSRCRPPPWVQDAAPRGRGTYGQGLPLRRGQVDPGITGPRGSGSDHGAEGFPGGLGCRHSAFPPGGDPGLECTRATDSDTHPELSPYPVSNPGSKRADGRFQIVSFR